jgi:hypothetical protein
MMLDGKEEVPAVPVETEGSWEIHSVVNPFSGEIYCEGF